MSTVFFFLDSLDSFMCLHTFHTTLTFVVKSAAMQTLIPETLTEEANMGVCIGVAGTATQILGDSEGKRSPTYRLLPKIISKGKSLYSLPTIQNSVS